MDFVQTIFSVKNSFDKKHKIIRIFGIKFSIKNSKNYLKKSITKIQKRYKGIVENLKHKDIINVTFMVSLISMFLARPFLDYLLNKQTRYKVKVLVIPDLRFGIDNAYKLQDECYKELCKQYDNDIIIKVPLDCEEDNVDIKAITDIMFCSLPYDVSHKKYCLDNLIKLDILPVIVNYGYFRSKYDRQLISSANYSKYWKIFVENKQNLCEYKKYQIIRGTNCLLTGYCKMDKYASYQKDGTDKTRKTIMIAPHHSVDGGYNAIMHLSNFYKYADFFLELPAKYPNIDWIFRPHPALFLCLQRDTFWGKEKVDKYIEQMKQYENVRYSENGDYLFDFAESDALIQDCGSFLVDYFYTNKPQCYMLKDKKEIEKIFSDFGRACLDNVYNAFNEQEIINFINDIVINGNDFMKNQRETFAKKEVMINYPNVASVIEEYFNKVFGE